MREIVKKKRNTKSKFYEYFLTQYGSIDCTRKATDQEIIDRMRLFINDLVFGNVLQEKYWNLFEADLRVLVIGLNYVKEKLYKLQCYRDCIQSVSIRNDNTANVIKMNPVFETCLIESDEIVKGYMIIYAGLNDFYQSGIQNGIINFKACNLDHLQNIAIQFKNPIFKLARKMVLSSY